MRYLPVLLSFAVVLCLLTSCAQRKQQEEAARRGLDAAVGELPSVQDYDTVEIVYQGFRSREKKFGGDCYYARAHIIIGTSLPERTALDIYVEELEPLGWIPEEKQHETSRVLRRGMCERIVARSGEPGVDIKDAVDYAQLKETYPTIIFVRVEYILPSRDEC